MSSGNVIQNGKPLLAHDAQTIDAIAESISQLTSLATDEFYFTQNGKLVSKDDQTCNGDLQMHLRLVGGKGGFGSMLRAIGAQIEKTTNREACRDLSGRRLRDINEEKRMKAWLDKQKEREEEAANKVNKKIQKLQAKPKHEFQDKKYDEARSEMTQSVHEALEAGLKNANDKKSSDSEGVDVDADRKSDDSSDAPSTSTGVKRKADDSDEKDTSSDGDKKAKQQLKKKKKKKAIKGAQWLGDDLGSSSDSDSDSESSNSSSSKSK